MYYGLVVCFFFQAEDGIRDLVRSRGLGDVYKRQALGLEGLHHFPGMLLVLHRVGADQADRLVAEMALSLIHI